MIATYIRRPIRIEACQWTGDNVREIKHFVKPIAEYLEDEKVILIHTLEGDMKANVGDYIIKEGKGKFYLCKEDIFKETYTISDDY